jgi:hypothetical protein
VVGNQVTIEIDGEAIKHVKQQQEQNWQSSPWPPIGNFARFFTDPQSVYTDHMTNQGSKGCIG